MVSLSPKLRRDTHNPLELVPAQWNPVYPFISETGAKAVPQSEGEREKMLNGNLDDCLGQPKFGHQSKFYLSQE